MASAHRLPQASQIHLTILRERQLPVAHAPLPQAAMAWTHVCTDFDASLVYYPHPQYLTTSSALQHMHASQAS